MEAITEKDLGFESDFFGYQITYKGIRIGGAGTDRRGKRTKANAAFHVEMAKLTIRDILNGRVPNHMKRVIEGIQKMETANNGS